MRSIWTCSLYSIHRWALYNRSGVFTARYALSPCIKRSCFVFKRLQHCYMFRPRRNRHQAIHTKHLNHLSTSCSANTLTRTDGAAQKLQVRMPKLYLCLSFPRSLPCLIQRCQRCARFSNRRFRILQVSVETVLP